MNPSIYPLFPESRSDDRLMPFQATEWNPFPGHPAELSALRAEHAVHGLSDQPMESPNSLHEEDVMNALSAIDREHGPRPRAAAGAHTGWTAIAALLATIGDLARSVAHGPARRWRTRTRPLGSAAPCGCRGSSPEPPLDLELCRAPLLGWWS
jgi:hypothetical protein